MGVRVGVGVGVRVRVRVRVRVSHGELDPQIRHARVAQRAEVGRGALRLRVEDGVPAARVGEHVVPLVRARARVPVRA